jgi:hypothetical protein
MADEFSKDINKGKGEIIRVEVGEFKGKKLLNIRVWYTDEAGEYKPTKKGITIAPELYAKVKEAFLEAEGHLQG